MIPLPPLAEQKRIVAKVDELMALCDELEEKQQRKATVTTKLRGSAFNALRQAETPDDLAAAWQRISTNWSHLTNHPDSIPELRNAIRNLAVCGKLTADLAGVSARVSSRETGSSVPKAIFDIPIDWSWNRLDELCDESGAGIADGPFGSKLKTEHYVERSDFRVVRLGNIGVGVFKDVDRSYLDGEYFNELAGYHLQSGDVLVASLGDPPGRACIVPDSVLPALNKADCFRVRVGERISNEYLVVALNSPVLSERAVGLKQGDTRGRINLSHLRGTPIPTPPPETQRILVERVEALLSMCDELEKQLQHQQDVSSRLAIASTQLAG
jgi:type I restriction enzyme S subunit